MADDEDYKVGYGKPPKATQFKKGQSGNPKGRPKGSLNAATVMKKIAAEMVTVPENGREIRMSKLELLLRKIFHRAAKGDNRSTDITLHLVDQESDVADPAVERAETPDQDEAIVHQALLRMREDLLRDGDLEALSA